LEYETTSGATQSPLGASRFLENPVSHQAELTIKTDSKFSLPLQRRMRNRVGNSSFFSAYC